ncbi:MAG: glycosyltransferase family 4 protein [Chlorobi bacterium]|nr:glycosyltransferase family 4 protein [Chlorobiota bacterium]
MAEASSHIYKGEKKVLFFLHKFPFPATDGTKARIADAVIAPMLEHSQCEALVVTWEQPPNVPLDRQLIPTTGFILSRWQLLWNFLRRLWSKRPWQVEMLYDEAVEQEFRMRIAQVDVVYVQSLRLGRYVESLSPPDRAKVLLDLNDAISRHYLSGWHRYPLLWRLGVLIEGLKYRWYEKRMLRQFKWTTIIADSDKAYLQSFLTEPSTHIEVVYSSAKPVIPCRVEAGVDGPPSMYFLANVRYYPNREGLEHFLRRIWPCIKRELPDAVLYVIGKGTEKLARQYAREKGLIWTGYLSTEQLAEVVAKARICVSPVRIGAGMQTKIVEALMSGKPVVAAAEVTQWALYLPQLVGLFRCHHNDPEEWAYTIAWLIEHYEEERAKLCDERTQALLRDLFDVENVARRYQRVISRMLWCCQEVMR